MRKKFSLNSRKKLVGSDWLESKSTKIFILPIFGTMRISNNFNFNCDTELCEHL